MRLLRIRLWGCLKCFIVLALIIFQSSCGVRNKQPSEGRLPKLPYKVAGASDQSAIQMQARLNKHGVRVVTLGQDYLVSIPSKALFQNNTPRLTWASYALLNDIARYLKQFRKVSVNVSAFVGKCISPEREKALTMARAKAVADYLWSQEIDSRLIFSHGLGSDKPIVRFGERGDDTPNSRVEITFRDAVV